MSLYTRGSVSLCLPAVSVILNLQQKTGKKKGREGGRERERERERKEGREGGKEGGRKEDITCPNQILYTLKFTEGTSKWPVSEICLLPIKATFL